MSREKKFRTRREKPEFDQKLLDLARVTRVVKGGRRFRFRATLVIGNRKGKVGVGVGKGTDVSDAIKKAFDDGRKHMIIVRTYRNTIPHEIWHKKGSARVLLKPAAPGRGIVAGGAVRAVIELAGIKDIVSKSFGSANKLNVARAALDALFELKNSRTRNARLGKKEEDKEARDVKQDKKE